MPKILVPTDFSTYADKALDVAATIAENTHSELLLVHVNEQSSILMPISEFGYTYDQAIEDRFLHMIHENLNKVLHDLAARHPRVKIHNSVIDGLFVPAIEELVTSEGVDLIVMGTKGASGLTEFVIGSNTQKIARRAHCPVLTVHSDSPAKFKNIVIPTTLEKDQKAIFETLKKWNALISGKIYLLYINNPGAYRSDADIESRKKDLLEGSGLENLEIFKTENFTMNEEQVIFEFAVEKEADLIVMGTHQRKGWSYFLLGSLTEDTINHASLPVFSIPLKK
jgi:nucleotide-binding universal stress UspA family protein